MLFNMYNGYESDQYKGVKMKKKQDERLLNLSNAYCILNPSRNGVGRRKNTLLESEFWRFQSWSRF